MSTVAKLKALSLAGVLLALVPVSGAVMAQAHVAAAEVSGDAVLAALRDAEHGDLRPVEALLAKGGMPEAESHLLKARLASAHLRLDEAQGALDRYFAAGDQNRERVFAAHEIAAGVALLSGRYVDTARHAGTLLAMSAGKPEDSIQNFRRMQEMGMQWANVAPQRVEAQGNGAPVLLARDKVGLLRSPVMIGGAVQDAVLDTGASISVVSESAAKRLGLRMMQGASTIGNSVGGGVSIRLAVADRLELGGAVVRNAVFVVMEDAALDFPVPGGYKIDAIIGLPVLQAIGRMEFNLHAKTLRVTPAPAAAALPANLSVIGTSPYVMMNIAGADVPLYFDTGANSTTLHPAFAEKMPDLKPVAVDQKVRKAGAGGVKHVENMKFHNIPVTFGQHSVTIDSLGYEPEGADSEDMPFGMLGIDILSRFETFAIDYQNMVLEVGRPIVERKVATALN